MRGIVANQIRSGLSLNHDPHGSSIYVAFEARRYIFAYRGTWAVLSLDYIAEQVAIRIVADKRIYGEGEGTG